MAVSTEPGNEQQARNALNRYDRSFRHRVEALLAVAPSMSGARVWRVITHETDFALRRWPVPGPSVSRIAWLHRLQTHAYAAGAGYVPLPQVSEDGQTVVESDHAFWELCRWCPGKACEGSDRIEELRSACRALASFHRAAEGFELRPDREPSEAIRQRVSQLASAATTNWQAMVSGSDVLRAMATQLPAAIPLAAESVCRVANRPTTCQAILCDARREHFLFTGETVTGLIDFGAASVDSPAVDLARLLGDWAQDNAAAWQTGLDAYGASAAIRELVLPLDASGVVLSCCNWIRWIAAGRQPPAKRLHHLHSRLENLVAGQSPLHFAGDSYLPTV